MKLSGRRQSKNVIDTRTPEGKKKHLTQLSNQRLLSKDLQGPPSSFKKRKK